MLKKSRIANRNKWTIQSSWGRLETNLLITVQRLSKNPIEHLNNPNTTSQNRIETKNNPKFQIRLNVINIPKNSKQFTITPSEEPISINSKIRSKMFFMQLL